MATGETKILDELQRGAAETRKYFTLVEEELAALNSTAQGRVSRLYDTVLGMLELNPSTGIPMGSVKNLSLVAELMAGIQPILDWYRKRYGEMARSNREELMGLTADRQVRFAKLFNSLGVDDKRKKSLFDEESFGVIDAIYRNGLMQINQMLEGWRQFAYDALHTGIVKAMTPSDIRKLLFNDNGTVKVGSSLDEKSIATTMMNLTEQRTVFLRKIAEQQDYRYCWNSNPMDMKTKPECLLATLAGVITEEEMGSTYGFPPRFICRCEIVYTRKEWDKVNGAVNRAIDERRQSLFKEMWSSPESFQKSKWKRGGAWVYPKDDILRLQGNKYYAQTSRKLDILADPVPEFDPDNPFHKIGFDVPLDDINAIRDDMPQLAGVSDQRIKNFISECY